MPAGALPQGEIMKKAILFLTVVALLVCLLAFSANASGRQSITYTDASGNTHVVPIVKFEDATAQSVASALGNNASMQALFVDNSAYAILKASDNSLTAYPSWYIIEPSGSSASYVAVSEIEYGYINSKVSDKSYDRGSILYIEFPSGMTEMRSNGVFSSGGYEKNVTDIYIPNTVTGISSTNTAANPKGAFNGNPSLKRVYIESGSQITKIASGSFSNSAIEYFQFDSLTELTYIDGFTNCKSLVGPVNLGNSKLVTIASGAFQLTSQITAITLPDTVETISDNAFDGCTNAYFTSPYMPKNLKTVGQHFMSNCKNINDTFIFPVGVTEIPGEMFNGASTPNGKGTLNVVFLGKMTKLIINGSDYRKWAEEVNVYLAQNTLNDVNASIYPFTDYDAGTLGTPYSQSGTLVVDVSGGAPSTTTKVDSNFNLRFLFCGNISSVETSYCISTDGNRFTEDRKTFAMEGHIHYTSAVPACNNPVTCIVCEEVQSIAHTQGALVLVSYPNGYANSGDITYACNVCTENYVECETASAIYVAIGYSYKLDGSGAVIGGYKINKAALDLWQANNADSSDDLVFGVVIFNPTKMPDGTEQFISTSDGKLSFAQNAIQIEVSSTYQYSTINFRVSGFNSSNYSTLQLVFAGYVYEKDNYETLSYAQMNYNGVSNTPIVEEYTRGGVTLHSVSAQTIDMLDGTAEGITAQQ